MKKFILPVFFVSLFAACSSTSTQQAVNAVTDSALMETKILIKLVDLEGVYADGKILTNDSGAVTVTSDRKKLDSVYKALLPKPYSGQGIYVKISGNLAINGQSKEITIRELLKAEQKNERNTSVAYDYWCMGNEPFWRIQISEKENLIDFFDPMANTYTHFKYVKPETQPNSSVYTAETNGNKIKITVTKQKCSDGMSERSYSCKAEVVLNDKTYKGCAVGFGELK